MKVRTCGLTVLTVTPCYCALHAVAITLPVWFMLCILGEIRIGGQEHFYMETQSMLVIPGGEDKEMNVYLSSQHPSYVQVNTLAFFLFFHHFFLCVCVCVCVQEQ